MVDINTILFFLYCLILKGIPDRFICSAIIGDYFNKKNKKIYIIGIDLKFHYTILFVNYVPVIVSLVC